MSGGNNIAVVCRFRPQNAREVREGGEPVIEIGEDSTTIKLESKEYPGSFTFDHVFGMGTTQKQMFEQSVKSIVNDVIEGYNGTIFAYGQTGSGKTFTMMGGGPDNEELKGIIPRIVETIFQAIIESTSNLEYTVQVSYMEIYMERIRDLLNPKNDNLPVHEDKTRGVYVKGLCEVYVSSVEEVYEILRQGQNSRIVAYTNMNAESSRSHSIFVITIHQKNLANGTTRSGKLSLVDLAGSEKVGKTGASGQTLEEAKKINKSLSALGMVINALTDGKSKHIPYRDSKLTRILQESLGGNSRTTLIINCSPSSFNEAETLSTLRFGMRAKTIKNKAKVNQDLSPAELKALLKRAKAQMLTFTQYIGLLEGEVKIWRSGETVPPENYVSMERISNGVLASPPPEPPKTPVQSSASLLQAMSRPETPALSLQDDEREEFLKRENELTDQLGEKEGELNAMHKSNELLKEELSQLRKDTEGYQNENKEMSAEMTDLRLKVEKLSYEYAENSIVADSLRESNHEFSEELERLRVQVEEYKHLQEEDGKEKKRTAKMAQMMAELSASEAITAREKELRNALASLESFEGSAYTTEEVAVIQGELSEAKSLLERQQQTIEGLHHENGVLIKRRDDLDSRLTALELEYEELLDKTIAEEEAHNDIDIAETINELRNKVETQYAAKQELQAKEMEEVRGELERKNEEIQKLASNSSELKRSNEELQSTIKKLEAMRQAERSKSISDKEKDIDYIRKTMAQQLADFDVMKKALMKDLQNRCERVVELEISLDEAREQYNALSRSSNSKALQKKMSFLERNLEQLTTVQKQLVEQNTSLKKEKAIAERKLAAKDERITTLQSLVEDAQQKLNAQQARYEAQLQTMYERVEQLKASASSNRQQQTGGAFGFGRIAKPLRGSRPAEGEAPANAVLSEKNAANLNRRVSWLSWRNTFTS